MPAGLADPLHLEPPFPWGRAVLLALAAAWAVWRLWRWWRRRQPSRPAPAPATPPRPLPATPPSELELALRRLLQHHRQRARRGCHELARLLRAHFGERGHRLGNRTARELERDLGTTPLTRLFTLLSELRFGRRTPTYGDLEGICELALEVARASPPEGAE